MIPELSPSSGPAHIDRSLADEDATRGLAERLSTLARPSDVIALWGDLGAGKTAFARAFIHALGGGHEVPSPTFTLVQTYDLPNLSIWHFDLFRLTNADDALELGIEEAFTEAVSLIEWPERLGDILPGDRLDLALSFGPDEGSRRVTLTGHGSWRQRLSEAQLDVA
jgi:tRNA threonylcarbamoyladenosine biosynthesis protein TsaE